MLLHRLRQLVDDKRLLHVVLHISEIRVYIASALLKVFHKSLSTHSRDAERQPGVNFLIPCVRRHSKLRLFCINDRVDLDMIINFLRRISLLLYYTCLPKLSCRRVILQRVHVPGLGHDLDPGCGKKVSLVKYTS